MLSGAEVLQEKAAMPVVPDVTGTAEADAVAEVVGAVALAVIVTVCVGGQLLDKINMGSC